jgi:hypothetical protein
MTATDTPTLPPSPDKGRAVSWSQMSMYLECGEKFRLSYIDKVPRIPQGSFLAGRAVHSAIEWAEANDGWRDPADTADDGKVVAEFINAFGAEIAKAEAGNPPAPIRWSGRKTKEYPRGEDELWWTRSAPMMLRRYAETRRDDEAQGNRVEAVEMTVGANLPSGTYVRGVIDKLLLFGPDGFPIIRDYKSGKPGGASPAQLGVYAWALRASSGIPIGWGEFVYLRQADEAKRVMRYALAEEIGLAERKFADFEAGRDAGLFPIQESNFCVSCSVRLSCPAGQAQDKRKGGSDAVE